MDISLLDTRVLGAPEVIGHRNSGAEIMSCFLKRPVSDSRIWVTQAGLRGDAQADLRVHGGPKKAVYVLPITQYIRWAEAFGTAPDRLAELGLTFGENLLVSGAYANEQIARTSDVWYWGPSRLRLEIENPRRPCYKLVTLFNRIGKGVGLATAEWMMETGNLGWYVTLADDPGWAPTRNTLIRVEPNAAGQTIYEIAQAKHVKEPSIPGMET